MVDHPVPPPPELGEIAAAGDADDTRGWLADELVAPKDEILRTRGGGNLEIYSRLKRDDQVASCWQQRTRAVIAREWFVEPGGSLHLGGNAIQLPVASQSPRRATHHGRFRNLLQGSRLGPYQLDKVAPSCGLSSSMERSLCCQQFTAIGLAPSRCLKFPLHHVGEGEGIPPIVLLQQVTTGQPDGTCRSDKPVEPIAHQPKRHRDEHASSAWGKQSAVPRPRDGVGRNGQLRFPVCDPRPQAMSVTPAAQYPGDKGKDVEAQEGVDRAVVS